METFYASMISLLFVSVSFTLHLVFYKSNAPVNGNVPPGKKGWLVIGETLEFLAAARNGHPEKFIFDRMARFSPHVFRTSLILEDVAVFCGSAGNKFLFSNEDRLVRAWCVPSLDKIFHANQQPKPEYNKMKKALSNFFMSKALHRYVPVMDIPTKGAPIQDLLSYQLRDTDKDGNKWTDSNIANKIIGFMVAGHENMSSVCAFVVKYLAEFPEVYQGVYRVKIEQTKIANSKGFGEALNWNDLSKMKYSWNVACEVVRVSPPTQGSFREAVTIFVYNGYTIPKGWKLYWSAVSTHKNPEYFLEPQKFDPTRFDGKGPTPYTFIPFGGGPHICPGKEYARVQILVFMHHLVRKFKWEKIVPDEKLIVNPFPLPAMGLPIRLYPHKTHT